MIDFARIAAAALPHVTEWVAGGKMEGREFVFLNPKRGDNKLGSCKINLDTGKGADFAANVVWGDAIALYAYLNDMEQGEAARELGNRYGGGEAAPAATQAKPAKPAERVVIAPVPHGAPRCTCRHSRHGEPSRVWAYQDASGALLGYVARYDPPDGRKQIIPWTYTADGWGAGQWPRPRPLYGLWRLAAAGTVLIVEGEKSADAAAQLLPEFPVLTWPGGSKAVKHADWTPLRGRKVAIWPDADEPGIEAAEEIAALLVGIAAGVKIINPPEGVPQGWDAADALKEGWNHERTINHIKQQMRDPQRGADAAEAAAQGAREVEHAPAPAAADNAGDGAAPDAGRHDGGNDTGHYEYPADETLDAPDQPFEPLGYDHGTFYYLARGSRQVVELTAAGHAALQLMTLAPLQWWERNYPGKEGPAWKYAANALMRYCERRGVYDASRIRGRGAWWDDGRAVLHLGDRLAVGDAFHGLTEVQSRYVYEAAPPMLAALDNPLTAREAHALVDICDLLNFEKPIFSKLLAGWCVIAPICGALPWRPHIWVTGGASTGKTWIMENIVIRCLGDLGLSVASETTEPGLRQALGHDARPVVFDEAEGENARAQERIQNVMALMRQASAETSAVILKGGAGGQSKSYRIRSCFAFASIGVGVQQYADKTRVTVLALHAAKGEAARARYARLKELQATTLTEEWALRLQARAISMVPTIRRNAEIFAAAGADVLGMQRMGDQLGALLAGAYALHSNGVITVDDARKWIAAQQWTDEAALTEQRDELLCMTAIMENVQRVQGYQTTLERTVGELCAVALDASFDDKLTKDIAADHLKRIGIKPNGSAVIISNTHSQIARILVNTPWAKNWARTLQRIEGARPTDGALRFGAGAPSRGVEIPAGAFLDE